MTIEHALAAAIERAVERSPIRRVRLTDVLAAAAAVDRTAAATVGWRARVHVALAALAENGVIELPRTRMDHTAHPPLPAYVTRPAAAAVERRDPTAGVVWHADLAWVAELEDRGELGTVERRFLAPISRWLPYRRGLRVPLRERSLEIFGNEKLLESQLFGPLFGPDRLTCELLETDTCWPPVEQVLLGDASWLIVENYTTYHSLSVRARHVGFGGRIVWGSGSQVGTRLSALASTGARPPVIWYFGDIDAGGLLAARLAERRSVELGFPPVRPAAGLYEAALTKGSRSTCVRRASAELVGWTTSWIGGPLGTQVGQVAAEGGRIVQEHVGMELLATLDLGQWFGPVPGQPS